jgi:hypothetical protein
MFFFEKKNQKTFAIWRPRPISICAACGLHACRGYRGRVIYGGCGKDIDMMRVRNAAILLALVAPGMAYGNCAREVHDITPKVRQIKDARARQRAQDYLNRAARELDENDEFECQTAVGAVQKILDTSPAAGKPSK